MLILSSVTYIIEAYFQVIKVKIIKAVVKAVILSFLSFTFATTI